jgi:ligand-binding sensor domain-containing protein
MKNYRPRRIIILVLLCSLCTATQAQYASNGRILQTNEKYALGDWIGYSNSRYINSISMGNEQVYFATTGGITRFNFYENTWDFPWTTCNGLPDNHILCVAFDAQANRLWCSTPVGISFYESFAEIWKNLYADDLNLSGDDHVLSFGFSDEYVWLETRNGEWLRSSNQYGNFLFESTSTPAEQLLQQLEWHGNRGRAKNELPILFMSEGYLFDSQGTISDFNFRRFPITTYLFDRWGCIWVGTWGLGVGRADTRSQQLELLPFGPYQKNITALNLDFQESFWIGGWDEENPQGTGWENENAVTAWNTRTHTWDYYQARYITRFNSDHALSLAQTNGEFWLGSDLGLAEFNYARNRWYFYDQTDRIRHNQINDVVADDDFIWVATPSGIDRLTRVALHTDSVEVEHIATQHLRQIEVFDLEVVGDTLWAGTRAGAYFYNIQKDSGDFVEGPWGPGTRPVFAVAAAPTLVWFGSEDRINVFDLAKNDWVSAPFDFSDIDRPVNFLDATADVVFAATDDGVWKFDMQRLFWKQFTREDGLIGNRVNAVQIVGDHVWFATTEGLCRFFWNNPMRADY